MEKVVNLSEYKKQKDIEKEALRVDLKASYECLDSCLKFLNMNNLKELTEVKNSIKRAMRKLLEMDKNV